MIPLGSCPHCLNPSPLFALLCSGCTELFSRESDFLPSPVPLVENRWIQGAFIHDGVVRSLFSRAKFSGDRLAMDFLLNKSLSRLGMPGKRCLFLPVPPNRERLLKRGVSIADQMAFIWGKTFGFPYTFSGVSGRKVKESKRLGQREREALSSSDRWSFGRIGVSDPVVLVDDLATTGWTLRTLAQGLLERGIPVEGAIVLCLRERFDKGDSLGV